MTAETDARSVLLALYLPADLDDAVEQARQASGLDRSKLIRDRVSRQVRLPVRAVAPMPAGEKVRRNVRWHPDEVALVEAYAAAAGQIFGRRMGVEDAVVELLHLAVVDPPELEPEKAPAVARGLDLHAFIVEAVRAELRPVVDLLRSIERTLTGLSVGRQAQAADPEPELDRVDVPQAPQSPGKVRRLIDRRQNRPDRRVELDDVPDDKRAELPGRRLGDEIRAMRERRGLTQRDAADAAGVSVSALQAAERGKEVRMMVREALERWLSAGH